MKLRLYLVLGIVVPFVMTALYGLAAISPADSNSSIPPFRPPERPGVGYHEYNPDIIAVDHWGGSPIVYTAENISLMNVSEKERQWLLTLADMTPEERDLYLDKQIENSSATDGGGGDSTLDVMIDDFWLWIFIPIWIVMVYFIGLWIGKLEGGVEIDVAAFEGANPPPGDVPQFEAWSAK